MKYVSVLLLSLTVAMDRIVTFAVQSSVLHGSFGFVTFRLLHNYGATMGIFQGDRLFLIAIGIIAVGILLAIWFKSKLRSYVFWSGWGLLTGGTIGNLWDRIVSGYVTDMFHVAFYPAIFNLADVAIRVGVIMMLIGYWRSSEKRTIKYKHS